MRLFEVIFCGRKITIDLFKNVRLITVTRFPLHCYKMPNTDMLYVYWPRTKEAREPIIKLIKDTEMVFKLTKNILNKINTARKLIT